VPDVGSKRRLRSTVLAKEFAMPSITTELGYLALSLALLATLGISLRFLFAGLEIDLAVPRRTAAFT